MGACAPHLGVLLPIGWSRALRRQATSTPKHWRRALQRAALAFGCAVVGLSVGFSSQAQAQMSCQQVRSELASLHNGGGGGRAAQLQQSFNQQQREYARAQAAYDRFQCNWGGAPQCGSIVAALNQMSANLTQMQRQLNRAGRSGGDPRRVAELERVFATQCAGSGQRQVARQPQNGGGLLGAIFGTLAQPQIASRQGAPSGVLTQRPSVRRGFDRPGETVREPQPRLSGSTFRTMCVRTSDGFYWPISFSTTRDRFDEDRSVCASMCPGEVTELFAYRNPGQQVDAMMNTLTGEPYTGQSYAFAYRESFDPNNRCTPSASVLAELRSSTSVAVQNASVVPTVPQPTPRPSMSSDPETQALQSAGVSFGSLRAMSAPEREGQEMVRIVGPNRGYTAN